jgi:hypothetical protein
MNSPLPGKPLVWNPQTASDSLDASTAGAGAMQALQNLIPDPTTRNLWQCRPAATVLKDFTIMTILTTDGGVPLTNDSGVPLASDTTIAANSPTFISCMLNVGTRIYGMYSASGNDQPFCYDVPTNAVIPITGVTTANTPFSPQQVGPWNPPHMELVGSNIIVTHPGFTGAGGAFFGVINVLNPFALTWTATNTSPTALIFPPQWVSNFNGRAYYLVNPPQQQPAAYFSDVLAPTTITNANQIITFDDNTPLTVSAGLTYSNQLGGIIQALLVFKGVTNIYQITGDFSLGTLSRNSMNVATGTFAPNSVCSTEKGLMFMAPDGIRVVDYNGNIGDPIGKDGTGITVPFIFSLTSSRVCAAFNGGVYRIQVQNGALAPIQGPFSSGFSSGFMTGYIASSFTAQQEWWFDVVRQVWSGPHTTNASLIIPYRQTFILTIQGAGAKFFQSDQVQSNISTFVENGNPLSYWWLTCMLPDTDQMAEVAMIETTLHMALAAGQVVSCDALDQENDVLDGVFIASAGSSTLWDVAIWDQSVWDGSSTGNRLFPRQLAWHAPLVFRRMQLSAFGASAAGLKIGRLHMRYEVLGYLQQAS